MLSALKGCMGANAGVIMPRGCIETAFESVIYNYTRTVLLSFKLEHILMIWSSKWSSKWNIRTCENIGMGLKLKMERMWDVCIYVVIVI